MMESLMSGMNAPLEQFKVNVLIAGLSSVVDMSITNSTLSMLSGCFVVYLYFGGGLKLEKLIGERWQTVGEKMYEFVVGILVQQVGQRGLVFFPTFFVLFFYILSMNALGLLPFVFTPTSHIIVTLNLGLSMVVGVVIIGFQRQGVSFLSIFVPKNVPNILLPFLVIIEVLSYLIRPLSLSIRLCANMMAGHTLLSIVSSFTIAMWYYKFLLGFVIFVLLMAILVLEVGIAFLQAYVFLMLVCVYLNDSLAGH